MASIGQILNDKGERLTVDATVRPVCAPALLLSLVDLDVRDEEVVCVQTLNLQKSRYKD